MADYGGSSQLSAGGIKKIDTGLQQRLPKIKLDQKIDIENKSGNKDFLGALNDMAAQDGGNGGTGIAVKIGDLPDANVFASGDSRVARLLKDARRLIDAKQHAEARNPLREARKIQPDSPEAVLLSAVCCFYLEELDDALRELQLLRGRQLDARLATHVNLLYQGIRRALFRTVLMEHIVLCGIAQFDMAVESLKKRLDLDSDCGFYYYLLAGTYMLMGKFDEALKAADAGLIVANPQDREHLTGLRENLLAKQAQQQMESARRQYRAGDYRRARSELARLDRACRDTPLWKTFDRYLADLHGGGMLFWRRAGSPATVAPKGTFKDVERLHSFLVAEEMDLANKHLHSEEFSEARPPLETALRHAPHYPFANFLYAFSLYGGMGQRLQGADTPELAEVVATLTTARKHAQIGATDAEIKGAPKLVETLDDILDHFTKMRRESEAMRQEAKPLNDATEEFVAIIKSVEKGISSPRQFEDVHRRMATLRQRLPGIRRGIKSTQGSEAMNQLQEAVDRNFQQLDSMKGRVENSKVVHKLIEQFHAKMQYLVQHKISNARELSEARSFFQTLAGDVTRARQKAGDSEAKEALDLLHTRVTDVLAQLNGAG